MTSLATAWRRPGGFEQLAIASAAIALALLVGAALAAQVVVGVALLVAACYGLVLLFAPVWALIAFVPLVFLEGLPALNLGGKLAGVLIAAAWIGAAISGKISVGDVMRRHRRLFECLAALLMWLCLTALWAENSAAVLGDVWRWALVALLFAIVATWVADAQTMLRVCAAFVIGAVLAVVIGFATGMVDTASVGASDPRLEGGAGDPNFLAAGLVPATVLAAALLVSAESPLARLGWAVSIAVCTFGIAASQSRGGLLALLVILPVALLVFRRRRIYVALACLLMVAAGAAYFSVTPAAWERISHVDSNGGSGRSDLWTVAWRMAEDHPVEGIGLSNYETRAKDYVRQSGSLTNVRKIAEDPHVVHNTYLEALAETGIVGLLLFLVIAGGAIRAAWLAGRLFEEEGDSRMEALSRAVVVGTVGMMSAAFFVSAGVDKRFWVLFALGPAGLAIAERRRRYLIS